MTEGPNNKERRIKSSQSNQSIRPINNENEDENSKSKVKLEIFCVETYNKHSTPAIIVTESEKLSIAYPKNSESSVRSYIIFFFNGSQI